MRAVIIGADHHNTLAVIRCLGKMKCPFKLIVLSSFDNTMIRIIHSKYVTEYTVAEETENALMNELTKSKCSDEKEIIIPCSDFAEYIIDKNADLLLPFYYLPGFQDDFGKVTLLMDKYKQKEMAEKYHIPMAKSWQINLENNKFNLPDDLEYPCIFKPLISAFGRKSDIIISQNQQQSLSALQNLAEKGYKSLIVQKFLIKKYECCAYGCIVGGGQHYYGGIVRKLREYPPKGGGSLTFAQFITDADIKNFVDKIQRMLWIEKYRGLYDIELLVCADAIYLNEINFRHSGNGYALINNKIPAPYIFCRDMIGEDITEYNSFVKSDSCHMDEINELTHLKENGVSIIELFRSILKTNAFSVFSMTDWFGSYPFYKPYINSMKKKIQTRFSRKKGTIAEENYAGCKNSKNRGRK